MFASRYGRYSRSSGEDFWPSREEVLSLALEAIWWALLRFSSRARTPTSRRRSQRLNAFLNASVRRFFFYYINRQKKKYKRFQQILDFVADRVWYEKATPILRRSGGKWVQSRELCSPSAEEAVCREIARERFRELTEKLRKEDRERLLVMLAWEDGKEEWDESEEEFLQRVSKELRTMVTEEEWEWLRRWLLE